MLLVKNYRKFSQIRGFLTELNIKGYITIDYRIPNPTNISILCTTKCNSKVYKYI